MPRYILAACGFLVIMLTLPAAPQPIPSAASVSTAKGIQEIEVWPDLVWVDAVELASLLGGSSVGSRFGTATSGGVSGLMGNTSGPGNRPSNLNLSGMSTSGGASNPNAPRRGAGSQRFPSP